MDDSISGIAFFIGLAIAVILIIVGVIKGGKHKSHRNAINNSIATLIEKRAIKSSGEDGETIIRNFDYKAVNPLEQEILTKGFEGKKIITTKKFHLNLKENLNKLKTAVDKTDISMLDFETKPSQRVSNSTNDDSALILPLVVFGGMEPQGSSFLNDTYAGEAGYSSGWESSGGSFDGGGYSGGDSGGGGGDGGGGGGGGD